MPGARLSRRTLLRRAVVAATGLPLAASLLAACGGGSSTTPSPAGGSSGGDSSQAAGSPAAGGASPAAASPSGSAETGSFSVEPPQHKGGQLIWGVTGDAQTANPVLSKDTTSGLIISLMFEGVMQTDVTNTQPIGNLAKSWDISPDGVVYSFELHDGVTFHDGQPLTANDVKFTYDLMLNPDTKSPRYSQLKQRIKSFDVTDDTHFSITLTSPVSSFLVSNMGYGILPQHVLKDVAPAELEQHDFSKGKKGVTIGTGPFMFEEWVKDDHVTLVKYPNYRLGEPNLDQWVMKVVPSAPILVQQLKSGEVDYGALQPPDVRDMSQQQNLTVHSYDDFNFTFYTYNLDPEKTTLFQDKTVRQALLYALDRQAIVDAVYFGLATVAVGTMPVLSWAYNPDGITNTYPYDPEKAKQLLDQAGWTPGSDGIRQKDGTRFAFDVWTTSSSETFMTTTTIFQQSWKQIGVECTPQTQEWNAFIDRITKAHDFPMMLVGFSWGVDPDQTTMWSCDAYTGGFNMGKYCNPDVDRLLQEGLATTDQAKRREIYTEMQNILMDDLPNAVLFFTKVNAAVSKRVHNLFPNAVNTTFNAQQWWVDG